jgi:hypothetical protein
METDDSLVLHTLRFLAEDDPVPSAHPEVTAALGTPETFTRLLDQLDRLEPAPTTRSTRGPGGPSWEDWLEGNEVPVAAVANELETLDALRQRLKASANPVRVAGERHSDNTIAQPQPGSLLVDLRSWQKGASFPLERRDQGGRTWVRVFAWENLQDLVDRLAAAKLAPINTGSFTGQTVAGPLSMGTHGSGVGLGALADHVVAIDLLGTHGPTGTVHRIRSAACPFPDGETVTLPHGRGTYVPVPSDAPLAAAVVNLGTFGVALSYVLEVRSDYWLHQEVELTTLDEALTWVDQPANRSKYRHVELVLTPVPVKGGRQAAILKRTEVKPGSQPRQKPAKLPRIVESLRDRLGRTRIVTRILERSEPLRKHLFDGALDAQQANNGVCGPWPEVLVRNTGIAAHGFEVHFPAVFTRAGISAVLAGMKAAHDLDGAKATAPIGVRFVKSGEQLLGMNHKRVHLAGREVEVDSWCTVEVPRLYGAARPEAIPRRILAALRAAGIPARPHWGQYFPVDQVEATALYPRLADWRAARAAFGADARFLTPAIAAATGLPQPKAVVALPRVAGAGEVRRVLCVPGVGARNEDPDWRSTWQRAVAKAAAAAGGPTPQVEFLALDDVFEGPKLDADTLGDALAGLLDSRLRYRTSRTRARGWLEHLEGRSDWDPEVVARWLTSAPIRDALKQRLAVLVEGFQPNVVVAHGLGGLVAYDLLSDTERPPLRLRHPLQLFTFGTQIGHQGLRSVWGGRLQKPGAVDRWLHVYDPDDPVFTAPITGAGAHNVTVCTAEVSDPQPALRYLRHPTVEELVWPTLLGRDTPPRRLGAVMTTAAHRSRKALLVGIDRYASPGIDLEGCVNDVYRISALLQSRYGYAADDIRLLTNDRATADAMRTRLDWLLEDARDGDQRVFYFSGHGARVPGYNALEVVDQVDECLVAHDFDWDVPGSAIVDDEFLERYAQLGYDVRFTALFDCCHSGGMARSGAAQARGITPPDDIRHRLLAWNGETWAHRSPVVGRSHTVRTRQRRKVRNAFLGSAQAIRPARAEFDDLRKLRGHKGPYMPVLLYGCAEGELAFEHRVGPTVYGAFTYALAEALQQDGDRTFEEVVQEVRRSVKALGYAQRPELEGPSVVTSTPFRL